MSVLQSFMYENGVTNLYSKIRAKFIRSLQLNLAPLLLSEDDRATVWSFMVKGEGTYPPFPHPHEKENPFGLFHGCGKRG